MQKRKIEFIVALAGCLLGVGTAFCVSVWLGVGAVLVAIPVAYGFYRPLIPTPEPLWFLYNNHIKPKLCRPAPSPKVSLGGYCEPEFSEFDADFYIAPHGNDENDGSRYAPFATFNRAKQAVRDLDKSGKTSVTVAVCAGEYSVEQISFDAKDGGTEACPILYKAHGGEVVLNGGFSIPAEAFTPISDETVLRRLSSDAQTHVLVADLSKLGLTREQTGVIHVIGAFHMAAQYDGDWEGPLHCELFVNDQRQILARYPNGDGFLATGKPIFTVGGSESEQTGTFDPEWRKQRNPKSDIYEVSEKLAERISSWETLEDVWMFGYWMYDWADASTPIGYFDPDKKLLSPKFVSQWGAKKGAPYYFFNVLEELDAPGEWYLDRNELKLYLYPQDDLKNADIMLSVTTRSILKVTGAEHLTFDGFTVQGTRGNAIEVDGDHIAIQNCIVRNSAGDAIVMKGFANRVTNCHICHTGKGGIVLVGGDRETLTPGNCVAENNLIHSWSEIYKTYCPAVLIHGVGSICRHNEMYDSPHEVIWYHGNDHIIEYNHIHHACLLTKDGGAIYAGKNWSFYGSHVRYNCIHDLGTPEYTACGIYMDDGMSGQSIYGNLLVNIPGMAIQLGGGRDFTVKDNVIVNCTNTPIYYDNRAREGALFGGWFHYCSEPGGLMWKLLWESPYRNEIWQKHYPQMAAFYEAFDQSENPHFVPNPGCSQVENNIVFDSAPICHNILCKEARRFGRIRNNKIYSINQLKNYFADPKIGNYTVKH